MAIIGANIPIPERDMSSGIAPAMTGKDDNAYLQIGLVLETSPSDLHYPVQLAEKQSYPLRDTCNVFYHSP